MVDRAQAADVTIDRHIVGRVGEDEVSPLITHKPADIVCCSGVAAQNSMLAKQPEVTQARDGGIRQFRDGILASVGPGDILRLGMV